MKIGQLSGRSLSEVWLCFIRVRTLLEIGFDLHADRFGQFDADFPNPAFVFFKGTGVLRRVDKNAEVGANASFQFLAVVHVLIEKYLQPAR